MKLMLNHCEAGGTQINRNSNFALVTPNSVDLAIKIKQGSQRKAEKMLIFKNTKKCFGQLQRKSIPSTFP